MKKLTPYKGMIRKETGSGWIVEGIGGSFNTRKTARKYAINFMKDIQREYPNIFMVKRAKL